MQINISTSYMSDEIINLLIQVEKIRTEIDIYKKISQSTHKEYWKYKKNWQHSYIYKNPEETPLIEHVLNAYLYLSNKIDENNQIIIDDILISHEKMFHQISDGAGYFRKESKSRNMHSFTHHLDGLEDIRPMMANIFSRIQSSADQQALIRGMIAWYVIEQISPFSIGNTAYGLILNNIVLKKYNHMVLPINKYIQDNQKKYYECVFSEEKDIKDFITFILQGYLLVQTDFLMHIKNQNINKIKTKKLPLRRHELLQIIKDHKLVSFDFLHRRFVGVSGRLLRYDLKKLQDTGLIAKKGVTKGVLYQLPD